MQNRRRFVKSLAACGSFASAHWMKPRETESVVQKSEIRGHLELKGVRTNGAFLPLEKVTIQTQKSGMLVVRDGCGKEYLRKPIDSQLSFQVAGALGSQNAFLLEQNGEFLDQIDFPVDCETSIQDSRELYGRLLEVLRWTMVARGEVDTCRWNGRIYKYFVRWLRDHVHTLKGMKYFYPDLKSAIDLYSDSQREDGMIWDNVYKRSQWRNWWQKRFEYGDFIQVFLEDNLEFKRIPVENDVEYLFLEGVYSTWKATGDDEWMAAQLDKCLSAISYSRTDPYRWSRKYHLLKRGFTIDTWDFQPHEDAALVDGDIMVVDLEKSRFGIMFGDNTGMAAGCFYLGEMLRYNGRVDEAVEVEQFGEDLQKRIDALAWNGEFYTHHIQEDESIKRDYGVDLSSQVSLSNAYSLNRRLTHEQCVAVIRTYQKILREMPESSPGEWYTIYPPFEHGFHLKKWEYMNGGVTPIVAGELAHGAFEHGFESYGANILERIFQLAEQTGGYLECAYRGKKAEPPRRHFTPVGLSSRVNSNYPGKGPAMNGRWIGETDSGGTTDFVQKLFVDIPFDLLKPDRQESISIGLCGAEDSELPETVTLPLDMEADSIYFLHTASPNHPLAGTITLFYRDGSRYTDYITYDKVAHWWSPEQQDWSRSATTRFVWQSNNPGHYVGFCVYGLNNPYPEKAVDSIEFEAARTEGYWHILGVTVCDSEVYFDPGIVSYGIPDNWGAAAVVYALIEGLAGIYDTGVAFDRARLTPRWSAAGVNEVTSTAKYEASGGYLSYRYRQGDNLLELLFTTSAAETQVEVLLPNGFGLRSLRLNGRKVTPEIRQVEKSQYACIMVNSVGIQKIELIGDKV